MKKIGLIGCGNIAETYFRSQEYFNNIKFISCADIYEEASQKCAKENNIQAQTVEELLSNKDIDIVLNLTIPQAHYEISNYQTLKAYPFQHFQFRMALGTTKTFLLFLVSETFSSSSNPKIGWIFLSNHISR